MLVGDNIEMGWYKEEDKLRRLWAHVERKGPENGIIALYPIGEEDVLIEVNDGIQHEDIQIRIDEYLIGEKAGKQRKKAKLYDYKVVDHEDEICTKWVKADEIERVRKNEARKQGKVRTKNNGEWTSEGQIIALDLRNMPTTGWGRTRNKDYKPKTFKTMGSWKVDMANKKQKKS